MPKDHHDEDDAVTEDDDINDDVTLSPEWINQLHLAKFLEECTYLLWMANQTPIAVPRIFIAHDTTSWEPGKLWTHHCHRTSNFTSRSYTKINSDWSAHSYKSLANQKFTITTGKLLRMKQMSRLPLCNNCVLFHSFSAFSSFYLPRHPWKFGFRYNYTSIFLLADCWLDANIDFRSQHLSFRCCRPTAATPSSPMVIVISMVEDFGHQKWWPRVYKILFDSK